METENLRTKIHELVDRIQDEHLLRSIYNFLKSKKDNQIGQLWNSLTETQRKEVLLACEESEDENNLIDKDSLFKK